MRTERLMTGSAGKNVPWSKSRLQHLGNVAGTQSEQAKSISSKNRVVAVSMVAPQTPTAHDGEVGDLALAPMQQMIPAFLRLALRTCAARSDHQALASAIWAWCGAWPEMTRKAPTWVVTATIKSLC